MYEEHNEREHKLAVGDYPHLAGVSKSKTHRAFFYRGRLVVIRSMWCNTFLKKKDHPGMDPYPYSVSWYFRDTENNREYGDAIDIPVGRGLDVEYHLRCYSAPARKHDAAPMQHFKPVELMSALARLTIDRILGGKEAQSEKDVGETGSTP